MKLTEREQRIVYMYCDKCNDFVGVLNHMESMLEGWAEEVEKHPIKDGGQAFIALSMYLNRCRELEDAVMKFGEGFGDLADYLEEHDG